MNGEYSRGTNLEVTQVEAGVRNRFSGKITEIKADGVMAEVKMEVDGLPEVEMTSVMTSESVQDAGFKKGDQVDALIKAVNVVFTKR